MRRQKTEKTQKKKWPLILGVVIFAVLIGAAAVLFTKRGSIEKSNLKVNTETAFTGSISVTTEGSGYVEAASTRALAMEYDGKLETIYVEKGDQVTAGEVLAVYDADALDSVVEQKEAELDEVNSSIASTDDAGSSEITAPVSGRIKRIYASVGDIASNVTEAHGGLAEISADDKLKVEFDCEEDTVTEGDSVTVEFDSWSVTGTVVSVQDGQICVTIPDDIEYKVDTAAVIYGKSGARLGEGTLESNHPFLVTAEYGIIDSVNVTKDTYVYAGDVLFERRDTQYNQTYLDLLSKREELVEELKDLKEYQKNPVVISEYDGYIVSLDVIEGMTYEKGQQVCTIADAETLNLKAEIDELDIDGVEVGQKADVVFDAFEDEVYEGTVEKISGVGNNSGGVTTYTVTISMEGNTHLKNAMSATATITLNSKDNVLLVPVDAVETVDGQKYVQVVENGKTIQTPVSLGLVNQEYAEVTEGLSGGEQVVVNTQSSTDMFGTLMEQRQSMVNSMKQ